jgi:competence protein ComEA
MAMNFRTLRLSCALLFACCGFAAAAGPVNINTADAAKLAAELTGVGPALADAIAADRQANGSFATPEALMRVKGIGARIVEMNKANILVADPAPPARYGVASSRVRSRALRTRARGSRERCRTMAARG